MKKGLLYIFISILSYGFVNGQESVYKEMSLDELLNVDVVVTASKKPEDLFEAPLSVTIIKKQDILLAGATSIPEALRLAPGLIVREMTPGNYDVHIRGFDDVLRNSYIAVPYNNIILVLIDNRIVYSYYSGGTYWEALPVDINDVERIEVVRGPASALYGPNAAAGVINIITSHATNYGSNLSMGGQYGNKNAVVLHGKYGYNHNDKIKVSASAHYRHRERWDKMYYDWSQRNYVPFDSIEMMLNIWRDSLDPTFVTFNEFNGGYKDQSLSMEHLGTNLFFDYQISEKSNLSISTGYQATLNQKPYFTAFSTSISQINANGYYVNAKWKAGKLYSQVSYSSDERTGIYPFHSDRCKIADANVEYDFTREKFSIRPGINIRQAYANNSSIMEGQPFYLGAFNEPYGNKFRTLSMYAFSTLAEWRPTNKLRIISGLRFDKFSINKNLSLNYEAGVTYRLNKNNMFRAVLSKANRAPFLLDTYVNMESRIIWPLLFDSYNNQSPTNILANVSWGTEPDIQYLSISSLELAWRSKISSMVSVDVEAFASRLSNPIGLKIYRDLFVDVSYTGSYPNIIPDSIVAARANANFVFDNYDANATQVGFTPTISFNWYDKFRVKVFGTLQHTFLSGEVDVRFDTLVPFGIVGSDPENPILHMYERVKINPMVYSTKSTPTFFGGLDLNYNLNDVWNFNVNGYFCTQQTHTGLSYGNLDADITGDYGHFTQKIDAFLVLNSKINYLIGSRYNVYISARNVLGKHREFGFADNIGSLYMIGFTYKF